MSSCTSKMNSVIEKDLFHSNHERSIQIGSILNKDLPSDMKVTLDYHSQHHSLSLIKAFELEGSESYQNQNWNWSVPLHCAGTGVGNGTRLQSLLTRLRISGQVGTLFRRNKSTRQALLKMFRAGGHFYLIVQNQDFRTFLSWTMCNVGGTRHNSKPHQHLKFEKTTDVLQMLKNCSKPNVYRFKELFQNLQWRFNQKQICQNGNNRFFQNQELDNTDSDPFKASQTCPQTEDVLNQYWSLAYRAGYNLQIML